MSQKPAGFERAANLLITVSIGAIVLLPALLDFLPAANSIREFALERPFAFDAAAALVNLFVLATLLRIWQDRAAKRRFAAVERIAMRSLSQAVNDVGRRVVGPLAGIDLHSSGIRGHAAGEQSNWQPWLENFSPYQPKSGFWTDLDADELALRIAALRDCPEFPAQMFRAVAFARREIQSALAEWASVVVLVPDAEKRLAATWELYDNVVDLAEDCRGLSTDSSDDAAWSRFEARVLLFNAQYLLVLHSLQKSAKLPTQGPRGKHGEPYEAFTPEVLDRLGKQLAAQKSLLEAEGI